MKYLRRFNEELSPEIYQNAADKLKKMGHVDRAKDLDEWADLTNWKKELEEYSKYGIFKITIKNPETGEKVTGEFTLDIIFDQLAFEDDPESGIGHTIGITPTTKELIDKCNSIMPEPDMGNGFYWAFFFNLNYNINNDVVEITGFDLFDYDDSQTGEVAFADRASANKFKNLMIKIYSDKNLDYPSGYTDADNLWDKLTTSILGNASYASEYGFKLEDVANYIRTISPNELYKSL
jgi:hypothetical protein